MPVTKVSRVRGDQVDRLDSQVHRDRRELLELLDSQEPRELLATLAIWANLVARDTLGPLETKARLDRQVPEDPRVHVVQMVLLVQPARRVPRVLQDHRDQLDRLDR